MAVTFLRNSLQQAKVEKNQGLLLVLALGLSLMAVFSVPRLLQSRPPIGPDAFIFEYGGWLFATGYKPYVTFWDVKPPGTYYLTGGIALLSGGNMYALHAISVVANSVFILIAVAMLMMTVEQLTDSTRAGIGGSLAFLAYPEVYILPASGFRPKIAVLALIFMSFYLWSIGRPLLSFAVGLLAPTFWQFSVVVPLTIAIAVIVDRRKLVGSMVAVGGSITTVVVLPVAVISGISPLLTETVIVPLSVSEPITPLANTFRGGYYLGAASLLALVGGVEVLRQRRRVWWLAVPLLAFAFQTTLLDLDGPPDMLLVYSFTAIGVGLALDRYSSRFSGMTPFAVIALIIFANFAFAISPFSTFYLPRPVGSEVYSAAQLNLELFWDKQLPKSCHIRLSSVETEWMKQSTNSVCE